MPGKMNMKDKLVNYPEVMDTVKAFKKIDVMYDSDAIKSSLDHAFTVGKVGILVLDCIVAAQIATQTGIGKVPLADVEEAAAQSSLISQVGGIKYLAETLSTKGLGVSVWTFLGDDDFKYSVSPSYSSEKPEVKSALNNQISALGGNLHSELAPLGVETVTNGWLSQEDSWPELLDVRTTMHDSITTGLESGSLPPKVLQRLNSFINWRNQLVYESGFDPDQYSDLIKQQAIQELTSFAFQGHSAPDVIHKTNPDLPLIFANTYPSMGIQQLDDECVRLGKTYGLEGYKYGTIHLPSPEKLAEILNKPVNPNYKPMTFSCGEKLQGSGKAHWQKKNGVKI